ncbi:MAG: hypothetical protein WC699_12125 [Bacteroidales bacterium]
MHKPWLYLPLITLCCLSLSCNIINPPEDIPSYIKVDTVVVKVTNFEQGSASHKMTCVKLNVGGTSLGIFEMPTMVPSLITGLQSLYLEPVFELNGIEGSRAVYPFFKPYIGTGQFDFIPGEIITIVPTTTYKPECKFVWIEDFEDAGVSFLYPAYTDTVYRNQTDSVKEGHYSGAIYLDKKNRFFEAYSSTDFELPKNGSMALLEFDYKSTATLEFGMYLMEGESGVWTTIIAMRPSKHWNRIYIDLNTTATENLTTELFRPAFRAGWDSTGAAKQGIIMDNIKLIHF